MSSFGVTASDQTIDFRIGYRVWYASVCGALVFAASP